MKVNGNHWSPNTEICVDLKTRLHSDSRAIFNKDYICTLVRDGEEHFSFTEAAAVSSKVKRNPHIFVGDFITATLLDNGETRLHFRQKGLGEEFTPMTYAVNVATEIIEALSLVEK